MPPKHPQKRTASSLDAASAPSTSQSKKKTRFVSPSDDPTTFTEQVDDALEDPFAGKRGRIKTEGYDSDSTDDGEGVVLSRKKDGRSGGDDGDDDMFAMAEKGDDGNDDGGKKKKEEFLRLGDIEGQEFNREGDSDGDDDEDEPEPVDEDEAERRKKAGMGYEMSSFNMREEMEEGKFASDGTYVKSFDPHAVHDRWMDTVSERDMKTARRNMKKREREEKERIRREAENNSGKKEEWEKELVGLLRKGESVLEALARVGAQAKKEKAAAKRNGHQNKDNMEVDSNSTQHQIDRLTTLASALLPDNVDIYSATYESLLRSVRSAGNVDSEWVPPSRSIKLEYKWADPAPGQEDQVFGPFTEDEMRAWYAAAYFGKHGDMIQIRPVGGQWGTWDEVVG